MTIAVEKTGVVADGLNITERVAEIEDQGDTIIPDFITPGEVAHLRHAFGSELPITRTAGAPIPRKTASEWDSS